MNDVFGWVSHYGYLGIFFLLVLGIIGLPVPDETMLAFAGYLVSRQILQLVPTVLAALTGSLCGITVSYTLGRTAGLRLVRRYGHFLHVTPERLDRVRRWFDRFGRWTLLLGYYVPGVRHLIALTAGTARLRYPVFALFAYAGGLLWSLTFISAGYFWGREWHSVMARVHRHVLLAVAAGSGLLLTYLLIRIRFVRRKP
jgi:membrane protein DedA with SNARE-associated domain